MRYYRKNLWTVRSRHNACSPWTGDKPPGQTLQAFDLLHQYRDHPFSFVDGVSFCIMKKQGVQDAFAFDSYFLIAGFSRVGIDIPL